MRVYDAREHRASGPIAVIRNGVASGVKMAFYLCTVCAWFFDNDSPMHDSILRKALQMRGQVG